MEQINLAIKTKRQVQIKLEDELEQYRIKINRANQIVCISRIIISILI